MLRLLRLAQALLLILALTAPLAAQQNSTQAPASFDAGSVFRPPMADQSEPADRIRYGGKYLDFGLALPLAVYTSVGANSAWQVGFLGGITAGFGSQRTTLYLRAADFHAGIPIAFRKGKFSTRVEFYHVSSHLGADYGQVSGLQPFHYSREEVEWLAAYDAPHHLRIYGGPRVLARTYPAVGRWTFQAGSEWTPPSLSARHWRFYFADDFQTRQEAGWRTNISIEPGLQWTTRKGEPVARLEAWFYSGQQPFGELFRQREHVIGAQLIFNLEPAIKSLITRKH